MENEINQIINKHFGETPEGIKRMEIGICNEVFLITLPNKKVVLRMHQMKRFLRGTSAHLPLFKSKNIKVPDLLFEDYSKELLPYAYQILSFIEGEDLGLVIDKLSVEQLDTIAKEVAEILIKTKDLPTNGKFGWAPNKETKFVDTWLDLLERMHNEIIERNNKTGVVDQKYIDIYKTLIDKNKDYFMSVPSEFVFDDMSYKNVIIKDGVFNGVIDLDQIMYGDFLAPVGRIMCSWYGTEHGRIYTESVEKYLNLTEKQKEMVKVYAILNRISWLSEIGIQYNQNTKGVIDEERLAGDKRVIELMIRDFL